MNLVEDHRACRVRRRAGVVDRERAGAIGGAGVHAVIHHEGVHARAKDDARDPTGHAGPGDGVERAIDVDVTALNGRIATDGDEAGVGAEGEQAGDVEVVRDVVHLAEQERAARGGEGEDGVGNHAGIHVHVVGQERRLFGEQDGREEVRVKRSHRHIPKTAPVGPEGRWGREHAGHAPIADLIEQATRG